MQSSLGSVSAWRQYLILMRKNWISTVWRRREEGGKRKGKERKGRKKGRGVISRAIIAGDSTSFLCRGEEGEKEGKRRDNGGLDRKNELIIYAET